MSNIAIKRILRDVKNCKGQLDSEHIYIIPDEKDIYHVNALILGPADTPYEKGFYFFEINFPKTYPHDPPKVLFMTLNNEIRFNPNLYKCGKVCLSILGTWSGPQWTSCITLKTVLFSIQSLLNENPLQNEPGFENCIDDRSMKYKQIVEYYNTKVGFLQMLESTPNDCQGFKPIMIDYLNKNYDFFENYIKKNINNKTRVNCNCYSLSLKPDYSGLLNRLTALKSKYLTPPPPPPPPIMLDETSTTNNVASETNINETVSGNEDQEQKVKKKKCPTSPAKLYDEGHILESDNDQRMYKVKITKSGIKRWVLNK